MTINNIRMSISINSLVNNFNKKMKIKKAK